MNQVKLIYLGTFPSSLQYSLNASVNTVGWGVTMGLVHRPTFAIWNKVFPDGAGSDWPRHSSPPTRALPPVIHFQHDLVAIDPRSSWA